MNEHQNGATGYSHIVLGLCRRRPFVMATGLMSVLSLLTACGFLREPLIYGPTNTAEHPNIPTTTAAPTETKKPTTTPTPTITPSPTITPLPTSTQIAGGTGRVIGNCSDVSSRIYELDLSTEAYSEVHDLRRTNDIWQSDFIQQMSPRRDRVIWAITEGYDVEIGWRNGERTILDLSNYSMHSYLSPSLSINSERRFTAEVPDLWLPGDLALFVDKVIAEADNLASMEIIGTSIEIAKLDGEDRRLLAEYKKAYVKSGEISPDGRYYVFAAFREDPDEEFWDQGHIVILDLESRSAIEYPYYAFGDFRWSPDGSSFTFSGRIRDIENGLYWRGLFLFDLHSEQVSLIREKAFAEWSPNGDWLAGYDDSEAKTAFIMRPDGSDFRAIDLPGASTRWGVEEMRWLPDGSGLYIISTARYNPRAVRHLLYHDLETDKSSAILEYSDWGFVSGRRILPSPDGRWIILRAFAQNINITTHKAIQSFYYVCDLERCRPFSPPGANECNSVTWTGHYSYGILGEPFK